jgi:uncharacterized protein YhdP
MQLRKFPIQQILLKFIVFIIIFYFAIIATSLLVTGYLFVSLDTYKQRIAKVILKSTGYALTLDSIHTTLNSYYLPEVVITNAKLTNPTDASQSFKVKRLDFIFSYASIWNLEPIFKHIYIDGTDINMEYLADGSIVINGINVNHPDQKTLENAKGPIDIENWILKQEQIKLSNINFSFIDRKNNLPELRLKNITTTFENGYLKKHDFTISFNTIKNPTWLTAHLRWHGGKVTEFNTWDRADFKLQSYNEKDLVAGHVQKYLPGVSMLDKFKAQTVMSGIIRNNKLKFFHANFDLKHFRYAIGHNNHLIDFPQIGGNISIDHINDNLYKIKANNLSIATSKGYIFKNKTIEGYEIPGKNGEMTLHDVNIQGFNNLLQLLPFSKNISLSGNIEMMKFTWQGNTFSPHDYQIKTNFRDLAIKSTESNIPNMNNVNGSITADKNHGELNLHLKNSILDYKKIFLKKYQFKNLTSQITWDINPNYQDSTSKKIMSQGLAKLTFLQESYPQNSLLQINLAKTHIQMDDFTGYAYGKYIYKPNTMGYLELKAHIDKLATAHVGDYLPIVIGMPVHKWLNMALISGYGVNANLDLRGWLKDFPFQDGSGRFYIDATIDHAKLRYVKGWPTLDDIMGKFMIRNQKIIIEATSGSISGNHIKKGFVVIPDMTTNNPYLTADGIAFGKTQNFMKYLQKTPINEIIGHLPDKVNSVDDGQVSLHLKVPFDYPEKTKVNGTYDFFNNQIQFLMPVPLLTHVNGRLFFTENGINIRSLTASALNSDTDVSAITDKAGNIHLKINSPNLDYKKVGDFYAPYISPIVSGTAPTQIEVTIGKNGVHKLLATSNLRGVSLDTPEPLYKESQSISSLNFTMLANYATQGFDLNFNYANLLLGKIGLNRNSHISAGEFALGTPSFTPKTSNKPKIMVIAKLNKTRILEWLSTIEKVVSSTKNLNTEKPSKNLNTEKSVTSTPNIFPIEILVDTPKLYFGKTNYQKAYMDILVNEKDSVFNINSVRMNGYGQYQFAKKQLDLSIMNYYYYESVKELAQENNLSKKNLPFAVLLNNIQAENPDFSTFESGEKSFIALKQQDRGNPPITDFPTTTISIDKFWFENQLLGAMSVKLTPKGSDLLIESGNLIGSKVTKITFSGKNYCMECGDQKAFVDLQTRMEIYDFGQFLNRLGHKNIIANGVGAVTASIQYNGKLNDFDLTNAIASINIDIKSGKFLKIDTASSLLAMIVGILNLQYVINFINLGFSNFFSNGFSFNQLNMQAYLVNGKVEIKKLYIWAATATINSSGIINLRNNTIDMNLSVIPHLDLGVAIGIGIATLNPIVGAIVYGAEWLLGSPVSKLFTFTFHITGSLQNPEINQIGTTKQVKKNVTSVGAW